MNKYIMTKLLVLVFVCSFQSAQAATITIKLPGDSSTYTTTVGALFDASIYIDSVPDFAGFDFNLTYNNTKLSGLTLTSGNIFGADTETFASSITPGVVHFAEAISFTSSATAGLTITAPTLLGTIHFQALNTGVNNLLNITDPILSDFAGNSLGGSIETAFVTINPANPAPIPLPASALLFAPGLLALFGLRKRKAQNLAG